MYLSLAVYILLDTLSPIPEIFAYFFLGTDVSLFPRNLLTGACSSFQPADKPLAYAHSGAPIIVTSFAYKTNYLGLSRILPDFVNQ